jgi:hypothetical protein
MIPYFISIQTEVRVKHEVDETDVHLKLEVEETKLRIKQEIEEMDNLLKLKSSEFLESRKAKQVLIEAFMGKLYPSK